MSSITSETNKFSPYHGPTIPEKDGLEQEQKLTHESLLQERLAKIIQQAKPEECGAQIFKLQKEAETQGVQLQVDKELHVKSLYEKRINTSLLENKGSVDSSTCWKIFQMLKRKNWLIGVRFSESEFKPINARGEQKMDGGTCSARSIFFLNEFLKNKDGSTWERVERSVETEGKIIRATYGEYFRNIQHAFNSIRGRFGIWTRQLLGCIPGCSFRRARVQAILNCFGLKIIWRSKSINVNENGIDTESFNKTVQELKDGAYLVRFINKSIEKVNKDEMSKGEAYGHSLIFIKEGSTSYLFDPNSGAKAAINNRDVLLKLFEDASQYPFNSLRFYRVEKKGPDPSGLYDSITK